ncbi:MAG: DNA-packaging protein [Sphingomonas sp.]
MRQRGWDLAHATRKLAEPKTDIRAVLAKMTAADLLRYDADFESWAHAGQWPPADDGWRTWLMLAGRGFGKTRAGAEWISRLGAAGGREAHIALVGATEAEVRKVMIEGPSGLIAVGRMLGLKPRWEPSLGKLTWPGGGAAHVYSADNPDGLRGPEHDFAWCDELAKWRRGEEAWTNLQMGLRRGGRPRALVTTTPRPVPLIEAIKAGRWTVTTGGRMDENLSLPDRFVEIMTATYGGTRLGRQELDGELIADAAGALWTRALVERCRAPIDLACDAQTWTRVVIGVDPPASADGDACGIVVCGTDGEGIAWVLEDATVRGRSPEGWAAAVAAAAERWGAELVVAEANQGGDMVASVLRQVDRALPVRPVRARYGKGQRAEPVALLFEQDQARLAGAFPALEDELCGLIRGGGYEGPGRSPDRADACVWAMVELTQARRSEPRVMRL